MYISVQDVKNDTRGANSIPDERIAEYIQTEEEYVKTRLGMDTLPDGNHILFSIIRDLASARCVLNLQGPNSNDFELALTLRKDAKDRLEAAVANGISAADRRRGTLEEETYNPYEGSFFHQEDYLYYG